MIWLRLHKRSALRLHGLLWRSTLAVIAASLLAATLAVAYTAQSTRERAHRASELQLKELLDTVQSTLAVACFAKDQTLAHELALGLLNNSAVLSIRILADDTLLADQRRRPAPHDSSATPLKRQINSPFDSSKPVGQIELTPDPQVIEMRIREEVWLAAVQLSWQLGMVTVALVLIMLLFVVRPIKAMSDRLHDMDATHGDRLAIPPGQDNTELGQLVGDINALADRLTRALSVEHQLRLQGEIDERKFHTIFDNAETGLFLMDGQGNLSSWNPAFGRLFGLGQTAADASQALDARSLPWQAAHEFNQLVQTARQQNSAVSLDLQTRMPDGEGRWINLVLRAVAENLLQGVVHDISHLKASEASARQQVVTDPLTGMVNRQGLQDRLTTLLQTPAQNGFTLLLLNLDEFRQINEGLGLPAGDNILKATSLRLAACLKSEDTLGRLAADHFGVILNQVSQSEVVSQVATRLLQTIGQPYQVDGLPVTLRASIGIALFPADGQDAPTLLRQAELALDSAKSAGGSQHVFFNPALVDAAEQRREMESDLRQALRNRELVLFFQPIVHLQQRRLSGAEALIRWRHPARGLVPPDSFIALAERTGLIVEIGLFVLEAACQQMQHWMAQGQNYTLSLNVSGRQIPDGLPPSQLQAMVRKYGINPARLALEITEGVMLHDIEKSQQWLGAVHQMGFRVYLDDFGTGYSSLSYLKRFPVDTLKVDKSFVQDIQDDNNEFTLVAAIIAMGRSLGLEIVAEGVEQESHLLALQRMGCHYAQGYYFSRPVPAEDFDSAAQRVAALLGSAGDIDPARD